MKKPKETGAVLKPRGTAIPIALVYPNQYRIGMGNLGFQFLYHSLNARPNFSAERFFISCAPESKSRERSPVSVETGRPLADFPIIAFSAPFESDYPAIPAALLAAGVPPLARDRGPTHPLVIAGGVSVSMNPEPLADFLDVVHIGELETTEIDNGFLATLAETCSASTRTTPERKELAAMFRNVPGAFVPSAYGFRFRDNGLIDGITVSPGFPERVTAVKRRSNDSAVPVSVLFSPEAEFGESLLVETNRGCGRGCRFCAAGWIHFPVRHAEYEGFRSSVESAVESGRTVGLIGSDLAGHPQLEEILADIVSRGGTFSLSSIRPEGLNEKVIQLMASTGQKTATLAPETASGRMKKIIGKEIPNERFYELVERLVLAGIPNLRFYFMVGLPTETDEDAVEIVEFVSECRRRFVDASRPLKRIGRIGVQVNPFVPKPWTPFQWTGMAAAEVLEKRTKIIHDGLRKHSNMVIRAESHKQAIIQAFLSRGDRMISRAILAAAKQGGKWSGVFRKEHIDLDFYVHRERSLDELFPWDITDHGIRKETLRKIYVHELELRGK